MKQTVRHGLGGAENPMTLSSHDWLIEPGERDAVWHQIHIKRGDIGNGPLAVIIERADEYEITLHRWAPYPEEPMGIIEARYFTAVRLGPTQAFRSKFMYVHSHQGLHSCCAAVTSISHPLP